MRPRPTRSLIAAASMIVASVVPLTVLDAPAASHATTLTPAAGGVTARNVTANLFMWNWNSVAAECTHVLGPDGYAAVQAAPPQDSLDTSGHPWWEVYQPVDYNLTSRMGDQAQFQAMVSTCHQAGVKVYVDALLNDMAAQSGTNGVSYGGVAYTPGVSYPDYSSADFHHYPADCPVSSDQITDWNNYQQVTDCELDGLPDLRTESTAVRATLAGYLNKLISFGVDGFRLDAAKHIGHTDLAAIEAMLNNDTLTGQPVYLTQEVMPGSSNTALQPASFENTGSLLGFDVADAIKAQFDGSIAGFAGFSSWNLLPSAYSSSFVNNHDTERDGSTLSYKGGAVYNLATEFLLAFGYGTPQVYASFEWNNINDSPPSDANGYVTNTNCASGWYCTDRVPGVANMVAWHNLALSHGDPVAHWYSDGSNLIAFSRGADAWIAINNETSTQTRTFATGLPDGTYCDVIHGSVSGGACTGPAVVVSAGSASVSVGAKDAVAIDVNSVISSASPTPSASPTTTANNVEVVNVTVPAYTAQTGRTVYLAGTLSALGGGQPDWAPNGIAFTQVTPTQWTATIHAAGPATLQYKYTLGGIWANNEETASCAYVGNRTMQVNGGTENDTVANWKGYGGC